MKKPPRSWDRGGSRRTNRVRSPLPCRKQGQTAPIQAGIQPASLFPTFRPSLIEGLVFTSFTTLGILFGFDDPPEKILPPPSV